MSLQNILKKSCQRGYSLRLLIKVKRFASKSINWLKRKNLYKLLRGYQEFDPSSVDQAYLVTIFTTSIIKQFERQTQATIETAKVACMFHDKGKMKMSKRLLDVRLADMSPGDLELYQNHPILKTEMVDGNNFVKQIIIKHNEYFDGSGFPFKKYGSIF